mgnify:FL=1
MLHNTLFFTHNQFLNQRLIQNVSKDKVIASNINQYISIDKDRMWGNPVIKGTRIPTFAIKDLVEKNNLDPIEIAEDIYPQLNVQQVNAALEF